MGDLTFYQWANALKGYMLAIGVAFGIYMIVLWWRSSQNARRRDNEARARSIYAAYLLKSLELQEPGRLGAADPGQARARAYPTFVAYLVTIADEILLLSPTKAWEDTLNAQLAPHRGLLASAAFRATLPRGLTPELRRLIDALARPEAVAGGASMRAAE
jgi:hypothetical protein